MSASSRPTFSPWAWRASARLQAVVDLPTPPLPEATATMWRTPAICGPWFGGAPGRGGATGGGVTGRGAASLWAGMPGPRSEVRLANTPETPGICRTRPSACRRTGSNRSASLGSTRIENITRLLGSTTT
jgi:hypothetical protein